MIRFREKNGVWPLTVPDIGFITFALYTPVTGSIIIVLGSIVGIPVIVFGVGAFF